MASTALRRRGWGRMHRLVAAVIATGLAGAAAFAFAVSARADSNLDEVQFVAAINGVRARNGLAPLLTDGQLINVARAWSSQMAGSATLSHNPDLTGQVSNWRKIGENVGTGATVDSIEAAFEASPHHYANMVEPSFNYVGVGVVEAGGTIWVTEDYKQSRDATPNTAVPQPAPPPSPRPPPRPGSGAVGGAPRAPGAASRSGAAGSSAAAPAAVAAANVSSPDAAASPAPSSVPLPGSGSAKSATTTPLALITSPRGMDAPRLASLSLFAVLFAAAVTVSRGLRPRGAPARGAGRRGFG